MYITSGDKDATCLWARSKDYVSQRHACKTCIESMSTCPSLNTGNIQHRYTLVLSEAPCKKTTLVNQRDSAGPRSETRKRWLRTNGVNTNEAAAKVMNFVRLGKRYALALLGR